MKSKIAGISLLFLFIIMSDLLYGAPCYGPNMPDKGKWDAGTEVNLVFERKLEKAHGEFKGKQYFIDLSYGFWDWFCFDGKIGLGNVQQQPETGDEIRYNDSFAGGYGFRIRALQNEAKKLRGIVGFQHISVHPDNRNLDSATNEAILDDWQLSFLLARDYQAFSPYCGFKISEHDLIHKVAGERGRKKSDYMYGLFLGADVYLNERLRFNLEGRLVDETAMSAALMYKF